MNKLQLFQPFIDLLKQEILNDIKPLFEDLKKSYQPKKPNEYLSRKEVCSLIGINLSTLWSYTKQKKLISYGIGNRVYYKRTEVEAAIIELKK